MAKLFKATGYLADGILQTPEGESLNFEQFPPFLRVLLTTDGTVTKSLESFFWEPIKVTDVSQKIICLERACEGLSKPPGHELLQRNVSLIGAHTNKIYTRAQSLICLRELPSEVAESLSAGRVGIGELLRECDLETYREILSYGVCNKAEWGGEQVWRTYRIVINSVPAIQVTEWFQTQLFY